MELNTVKGQIQLFIGQNFFSDSCNNAFDIKVQNSKNSYNFKIVLFIIVVIIIYDGSETVEHSWQNMEK